MSNKGDIRNSKDCCDVWCLLKMQELVYKKRREGKKMGLGKRQKGKRTEETYGFIVKGIYQKGRRRVVLVSRGKGRAVGSGGI